MNRPARLVRSATGQRGQTTTEYALLLGFLAIAIIVALFFLENTLRQVFSNAPIAVFVEIDRTLAALPLGTAVFAAPEELEYEEVETASLVLSLDEPLSGLQEELNEVGQSESAVIQVAPRMRAEMSGSGFSTTPITPEVQAVSAVATTEWRWEVEGTRPGERELRVTLSALIRVDGEQTERVIKTFEEEVEVKDVPWAARAKGFVADNWQWLWVFIVLPIAGLIWKLWRRRRKRPPDEYGWPDTSPSGD